MLIQTKLNPTPPDPIQAKVMLFMPIIFTGMFLFFPAGLVLYWIGQQRPVDRAAVADHADDRGWRKETQGSLTLIAAIATAPGRGGIGVVRVSGTDLARTSPGRPAARNRKRAAATLADFRAGDGSVIDQGIALYFPAPHSFTGEDVLELQGHGGPVVMQTAAAALPGAGRAAGRAGRIHAPRLPQRQARSGPGRSVADLIEASTAAGGALGSAFADGRVLAAGSRSWSAN